MDAKVTIRPTEYRHKTGFLVSWRRGLGWSYMKQRVFVEQREQADAIKTAIKAETCWQAVSNRISAILLAQGSVSDGDGRARTD